MGKEGFTAQPKVKQPAEPPKQISPQAEAENNPNPAKIKLQELSPANWIALYQALGVKGILQSTVANCVLIARQDNVCHFALDESKGSLYDPNHADRLAGLLTDYFAESIKVDINLQVVDASLESPAQYSERIRKEKKAAAIAQLNSDPNVQVLKTRFDAVLDEDSVTFK